MRELGVRHVAQGCADKVDALLQLTRRLGIDPLAAACLVDDTPDLPLMAAVGFAAAVADAHPLVRSAAHWVSEAPGRCRRRARAVRCAAARALDPACTLMAFRIFTVLAVIALGVSTWFLSSPSRRPRATRAGALAQLPGYYLKNAVLTDYDENGAVSIRIHADRIDQVDHSPEVALYNVRVDYQSPQGQAWVLLGDTGHVESGGKIIDVAGNVRLEETSRSTPEPPCCTPTRCATSVPDAIATTQSDVRIDFGVAYAHRPRTRRQFERAHHAPRIEGQWPLPTLSSRPSPPCSRSPAHGSRGPRPCLRPRRPPGRSIWMRNPRSSTCAPTTSSFARCGSRRVPIRSPRIRARPRAKRSAATSTTASGYSAAM